MNATATPGIEALHGTVVDASGAPLIGVMVTALDAARFASVSVFSGADGRFEFPTLAAATYQVRAHRTGWADAVRDGVVLPGAAALSFSLASTADLNAQLPPTRSAITAGASRARARSGRRSSTA